MWLREQERFCRVNPDRRHVNSGHYTVKGLRNVLGDLDQVAADAREAFEGLIEPCWLDEYLRTRIEPLREELPEG